MEKAVPSMAHVAQHVLMVPAEYAAFMASKHPFDGALPGRVKLTLFQRLLLVKLMHDGKTVAALVRAPHQPIAPVVFLLRLGLGLGLGFSF